MLDMEELFILLYMHIILSFFLARVPVTDSDQWVPTHLHKFEQIYIFIT